jgi:hypothetical protein
VHLLFLLLMFAAFFDSRSCSCFVCVFTGVSAKTAAMVLQCCADSSAAVAGSMRWRGGREGGRGVHDNYLIFDSLLPLFPAAFFGFLFALESFRDKLIGESEKTLDAAR